MKYYGKSHTGLRRKNNQDSITLAENHQHVLLAVVCDGIGGGRAGDVASAMATTHMKERFLQADLQGKRDVDIKNWLRTVIQEANDLIFTQAARCEEHKGMGTTMVGILYCAQSTYVFNVGDSRTYGLYSDDFLCLTEDHSYVADLLKRGEVSEEEAKHHPNRNVLTNALGIWDSVKIDINKVKEDYQMLLICSDGLHGYVSEELIRHIMESECGLQARVDLLIQAALDAGGFDNVSVILLEKEDSDHE